MNKSKIENISEKYKIVTDRKLKELEGETETWTLDKDKTCFNIY